MISDLKTEGEIEDLYYDEEEETRFLYETFDYF